MKYAIEPYETYYNRAPKGYYKYVKNYKYKGRFPKNQRIYKRNWTQNKANRNISIYNQRGGRYINIRPRRDNIRQRQEQYIERINGNFF